MNSGKGLSVLGWVVCLAVLAAVVAGLLMVGSPAQARREKADSQRVTDLEWLAHSVRQYYLDKHVLPATLDLAFSRTGASWADSKDPETGAPYAYRVVDEEHFELCAVFETDQSKADLHGYSRYSDRSLPFWRHKAGRQCFTLFKKS